MTLSDSWGNTLTDSWGNTLTGSWGKVDTVRLQQELRASKPPGFGTRWGQCEFCPVNYACRNREREEVLCELLDYQAGVEEYKPVRQVEWTWATCKECGEEYRKWPERKRKKSRRGKVKRGMCPTCTRSATALATYERAIAV